MNFLKKLALATSSGTVSYYPSPDPTYRGDFSTRCLHNLLWLIFSLGKYLLICEIISLFKLAFNCLVQKTTKATPSSRKSFSVIDWAPLVKTPLPVNSGNTNTSNINQNNASSSRKHLAGRSVLCVGGRIKLYPEYRRLIENSCGSFIAFHGDTNDRLDNLPKLLEDTDMIICPVDCVNHNAFFIVKHYCLHSGKPCVLLDRSEVDTFDTGIHMLATIATKETFD
ncbi:MAG: DUF2325 domain-containing protein [Nitrosomonas sp.]